MKAIKLPLILLVLSLFTHFLFFGQPNSVVFDEVYMGSFVSDYSSGQYYFDIHPPLAKLITKVIGDMIGVSYDVDFSTIGNHLTDRIIFLRLLPLLAGVLLPLIIYFICRQLKMSELSSFVAGLLIILENSLLTQSRFILFDSLLLLFGFSSILLYLLYIKSDNKAKFLIWSAILAAAAFSIKWTGLAYPLLILISEIWRTRNFRKIAKLFFSYAVIGAVIYMSAFAIHFAWLKNAGPGDAFMSDRFQKTLVGNTYHDEESIKAKGFFGKFIELNIVMYETNKTLTATHSYSSKWYTWPFMLRPVFYWQGQAGDSSYIYFFGNPIIYWLGSGAIILLFFYSANLLSKKNKKLQNKVPLFIFTGFLVNFLPFIFIGRVMFLYHYEAALVFSILALVFFIDTIKIQKTKLVTSGVLVGVCLVTFIFFAPLTYGTHLNDAELKARMWLSTWR